MPLVQQIPRIFSDTPRPVVDARLGGPAFHGTSDDWKQVRFALAMIGHRPWACDKAAAPADHFLDPEVDPREGGPRLGDERATLTEFLRRQRLTLQLKCDGLDPLSLGTGQSSPQQCRYLD
jgi:hypothetical protein